MRFKIWMVLLSVVFVSVTVNAATITVCSPGCDYTNIQDAVDNANDSDTILVSSGSYYGAVNISKSITLKGDGADTTTIHGEWLVDKVVHITADNVTVSGFTVTGTVESGAYGIYVDSADYCNISDNIISDGDYGIYLSDSDYSVVARNNASDHKNYGIYLRWCDNCLVDENIVNVTNTGIHLQYSDNNSITGNGISSNYRWVQGVYLSQSHNNSIANNIANSNEYGIYLQSSSGNSIVNNIANSNEYGIYLQYSSSNNIVNNTASLNQNQGISLYHSSSNNITSNIASGNNHGIYLYSTSLDNIITKNTISYNNEGIHLYYSGKNQIYLNNIIANTLQAYDHNGFNEWDNGTIIGGNYWSDHKCTGNPSNGSQPYTKIDTNADAVDHYPHGNYCVPPSWKTIYVPDNYSSIQTAVNAANTGDTIIVRDGTYIENVKIGKILVIRSENGSATTAIQAFDFNDHVLEVSKQQVTITGFTITGATGSDKAGIYLGGNAENCNIFGNNVSNNNRGIYLRYSSSNNLVNNTASLNDHGIYLYYSSSNNLVNNTASLNYYGIYLSDSSNNLVNNTASLNGYGIYLHHSSSNNIVNNNASLNDHGIYLYDSSSNNLVNNTANLNNQYGIKLSWSSNNNISRNTANSNNNHGIHVYYSSSNSIVNNTVNSNNHNGISLSRSSINNLINNTASLNQDHGIYLDDDSEDNDLVSNTVDSNYNGIYLEDSSSNSVINNSVNSNWNYGIYLDDSSTNSIISNIVNSNGYYGLYLSSSGTNLIYNNYFNNTNNVHVYGTAYTNYWNTTRQPGERIYSKGNETAGNYWTNPSGTGYSDTCTDLDMDGFCDSSHILNSENIDYLPLSDEYSSLMDYNISLFTGWNLISTPLKPANNSIEAVISGLADHIIITTYNTSSTEWYTYDSTSPESATLHEIVAGRGYWLYLGHNGDLTIHGYETIENIKLSDGWNLIGYNHLLPKNIPDILSGYEVVVAFGYNTTTDSWNIYNSTNPDFLNTLTEMESGKGYWVGGIPIPT